MLTLQVFGKATTKTYSRGKRCLPCGNSLCHEKCQDMTKQIKQTVQIVNIHRIDRCWHNNNLFSSGKRRTWYIFPFGSDFEYIIQLVNNKLNHASISKIIRFFFSELCGYLDLW